MFCNLTVLSLLPTHAVGGQQTHAIRKKMLSSYQKKQAEQFES